MSIEQFAALNLLVIRLNIHIIFSNHLINSILKLFLRFYIKKNSENQTKQMLLFFQHYFNLPGISLPPHEQSGNKQTSLRHLAAVLSGVGCG